MILIIVGCLYVFWGEKRCVKKALTLAVNTGLMQAFLIYQDKEKRILQ